MPHAATDADQRSPVASRPVGHVVVLGAGLAGLAATAALARRAKRVTVIEQDPLADGDGARRGVPQGRHVNVLLPAGLTALGELFPALQRDLAAAGAQRIDRPEDVRINMGGGRLRLDRLTAATVLTGATRPLIEGVLREPVRALPNVVVRAGWRVVGLAGTPRAAVRGVLLQPSAAGGDAPAAETLEADLVVDATGRGSRAPRWLTALGFEAPREERVQVDLRYTTRMFRRRRGDVHWRIALIGALPGAARGGVALAVEDDRWIVTLTGLLGEQPPGELDAFRAFAGSLWSRDIHGLIADAEPLGDAQTGAYPANAWRRFDRLRRHPARFVAVADAVCPLNPLYAQGMSVAALEALTLGRLLERVGPARVGPAFYRATRPLVEACWTQATDSDLRHPAVEGRRSLRWRLLGAYSDRLVALAHRDAQVARALFEVMCLLAPPQRLMRPAVAGRVLLRGRRRARGQAAGRERRRGAGADPEGRSAAWGDDAGAGSGPVGAPTGDPGAERSRQADA